MLSPRSGINMQPHPVCCRPTVLLATVIKVSVISIKVNWNSNVSMKSSCSNLSIHYDHKVNWLRLFSSFEAIQNIALKRWEKHCENTNKICLNEMNDLFIIKLFLIPLALFRFLQYSSQGAAGSTPALVIWTSQFIFFSPFGEIQSNPTSDSREK